MKRTKQTLTFLLALLLFASLFACTRIVPAQPQASSQTGGIDAPVYTLEPQTEAPAFETPAPADSSPDLPIDAPTDVPTEAPTEAPPDTPCPVSEDGEYWTKDDVALYIHLFGHLPKNYITKSQAQSLGWSGGSLEPYAPGCSIGGGYFGNYEGLLPQKKGRSYTECDIDTRGAKSRGAKRIVFSNDGLIYYTDDHYASFTLLYGED